MEKRVIDTPHPTDPDPRCYIRHYPSDLLRGKLARVISLPQPHNVRNLLERIVASYRYAHEKYMQQATGVWNVIEGYKKPIHDAAMSSDIKTLGAMLHEPGTTMLFHGFDQPTSAMIGNLENPGILMSYHNRCLGSLRRLAEAIGAISMAYPEGYGVNADVQSNAPLHADEMLDAIEKKIECEIRFPNVFLDEYGIDTTRGIAAYRAIQSLYQGWRITTLSQITSQRSPSAFEIGGGTGRCAYYAYQFGVRDYSIVDLPMTGIAQAYFLGRTLGEENVCLDGEPIKADAIKLFSPPSLSDERRYDVAASFDALVEFSEEVAKGYLDFAANNARVFLSINRESKSYTVRQLLEQRNIKATRSPYWLRQGYAEEIAVL